MFGTLLGVLLGTLLGVLLGTLIGALLSKYGDLETNVTKTMWDLEPPPIFKHWETQYNKEYRRHKDSSHSRRRKRTLDRYLEKPKITSLQDGHRVMDKMREMLATFDRSANQMEMHELMLQTVLQQVYGANVYFEHEIEILEYNGFSQVDKEIMITAPRRFGKSWAVAMFVAVCLLCIRDVEVSIFSSCLRTAGAENGMSGIIRRILINDLKVPKEQFCKDNQQHIFLKISANDIRKLNAYPSSTDT